MEEILIERAGSVATVTLNRPERYNAVPAGLWAPLGEMFTDLGRDPEVRVVVVTGAGRAFCSGADLGAMGGSDHPLRAMRDVSDAALALHRLPKPTIARVNGVAAGAGANLALACDLVVASEDARFCEIFAKRGLSVDFGGSWLLPRLVGMHKAKELVLLADMVSAADAERIGLVNRVVAADRLDEAVAEWAERLAAGPQLALASSKALLNRSFESSFDQALDAEGAAQAVNLQGPDLAEAVAAFAEKRNPDFRR